jgi:hypothetical protein
MLGTVSPVNRGGWDVAWGGFRGSLPPAAVPWNRTSERVRIPSRAGARGESTRELPRVELFGIAALAGGTVHLPLHTGERPIANKYREGKMKSTLKRE